MDRDELARRLSAVFREELSDHIRTWDEIVLRLERDGQAGDGDVQQLFRIAHSLKGASRTVGLDVLEAYCHGLEERLDEVRRGRVALEGERVDELLTASAVWAEVAHRLAAGEPIDESAVRASRRSERGLEPTASTLRIEPGRLDGLLAHAGELLRVSARLEQRELELERTTARIEHARSPDPRLRRLLDETCETLELLQRDLVADVREIARLSRAVDDDVRSARLIPFSEACEGLVRAARDVARTAGRDVELDVRGGAVELDRAIVEGLRSPLVQLVKNAVVHGAEPPAGRAAAGKPTRARIEVSATLRGSEIEVRVEDDGCGLDLAGIAARARALGVDPPEEARALSRLVFLPGLSTASKVDTGSGRGVGLDIVKAHVEAMHGRVEVSTEPQRGTSFVLAVPLTLTLLRALLVRVDDLVCAIPSTHVLELRRVDPEKLSRVGGRLALVHDGEPVPVEPMALALGLTSDLDPPAKGRFAPTVVIKAARERVALMVDELLSVEDVVVEGLGRRLSRVRNVAGATVLANGEVALILHGGELVQSALSARVRRGPLEERERPAVRRLLVVDDSLTTRVLEKTILESAGYRVLVAGDGSAALAMLERETVDLVVADVEMPRMNGIELTLAIRRSPRLRGLPVVLLTGLSRDEDRARGLDAGADAYLVKSAFDQTELLETVGRLLSP